MKYNEYVKVLTSETQEIIRNGVAIFSCLRKEKIYKPSLLKKGIKEELNNNDKILFALFLSILSSENEIKDILGNYDVNYIKISLLTKIKDININNVSSQDIDNIFNSLFRVTIENFLNRFNAFSQQEREKSTVHLYRFITDEGVFPAAIVNDFLRCCVASNDILKKIDTEVRDIKYIEHENSESVDEIRDIGFRRTLESKKDVQGYGKYLTDNDYIVNPAIGREREITRLEYALANPSKTSAILVGEPGVGKTAIVKGLAYKIKTGDISDYFKGYKILSVKIPSLVSGTKYRGDFEQRVENLIKYVMNDGKTILFLDEFHCAIGTGSSTESRMDTAEILKPYLDCGDIKIIGATTTKEYEYLNSDPAIKRRLEYVLVKEQDPKSISAILLGTLPLYEKVNNVKFGLNGELRSKVMDFIVSTTNEHNRIYNDKQCNPALALSILGNAFAIATVDSKDKIVRVSHIAKAIEMCERLYEDARTRNSIGLQNQHYDSYEDRSNNNIINFEDYCRTKKQG